MSDPRTPKTKEAQLPDALDQQPGAGSPADGDERGSEDAQLLVGADGAEGDVESAAGRGTND